MSSVTKLPYLVTALKNRNLSVEVKKKVKCMFYFLCSLFEYEHKTITAKRQVDQHFILISLSGEDAWGCTVKTFICKQF